jgi:hypothetical protein
MIDFSKVETESTNSRFLQEQTTQLLPLREWSPVGWLRLSKATSLMDHDVQKARVALERGISKSWLTRPGGIPQPVSDPNVPLRIQVVPSSGWRLEGRAWLDSPVLYWEDSEIECLGKPWAPSTQDLSSTPSSQIRARIEVWEADIFRLWGSAEDNPVIDPLSKPILDLDEQRD